MIISINFLYKINKEGDIKTLLEILVPMFFYLSKTSSFAFQGKWELLPPCNWAPFGGYSTILQ